MKIKMVSVWFLLVFAMIPAAFAGKTELTTYYPAPYGEYQDLIVGSGSNTYPTTPAGSYGAITLNGASLLRMVMNDGNGNFNTYLNSYYDSGSATFKYALSAGANRFSISGGTFGLYVAPSGTVGNDITWTTGLYVNTSGDVGIGTTSPTAQLHVAGDLKVDGSRIIRKLSVQTNATTYSATTAWALGPTFGNIVGFKAGSLVRLSYHMPMRNDSASWGGGYIEPQISFNGGTTWNSLGSCGYDGAVMNSGAPSIGSYFNTILIDPAQAADFSVAVRFYFMAYDGTVTINGSHNINAVSGTATIMSGVNGTQHYAKIIIEELY